MALASQFVFIILCVRLYLCVFIEMYVFVCIHICLCAWVLLEWYADTNVFVNVWRVCWRILGSNHFGIAGWYSMQAMDQGLLVRITTSILVTYIHPTRKIHTQPLDKWYLVIRTVSKILGIFSVWHIKRLKILWTKTAFV